MVAAAFKKAMSGGMFDKIVGIRSGLPGMVYSHSELYFYEFDFAYAVTVSKIGWTKRDYDLGWDLMTLPIDSEEEQALEQFCNEIDQSRPQYDWPGLVHIGLLNLAGRQFPKWWFCSEQCAWALRRLGYLDLFYLSPESYTPALLAYAIKQWKLLPEPIQQAMKARAKATRGVRV